MILFASDLDNTLIYSYKRVAHDPVWVEYKDEKQLSFMTGAAYQLLQEINTYAEFVPITTRSLEQYQRICFFTGKTPRYALCSNGGILLKDNVPDEAWFEETKILIADASEELTKAADILQNDKNICFDVRKVDDIFIFTKTKNVKESSYLLEQALDLEKVFIDSVGEKIYVFPKVMDKGTALKRLKEYLNPDVTFAAGDSTFDIPMLVEADIAVIPNGSPLKEFIPENVRCYISQKQGVSYAEEVLSYVIGNYKIAL